jgi:GAF domain-containing protein
VFRYVDAASQPPPVEAGVAGPLEDSYCQRIVDGRLPQLIHDAGRLPAAVDLSMALPVGAHLSVPIRLDNGDVYGTLSCFSAAPDYSLNERDLALMHVFAKLIGGQLERKLTANRGRQTALARLHAVMSGNGLSMVYQPIVDLRRGRPMGYEALARFTAQIGRASCRERV